MQLFEANALGWGGYLAVGLRCPQLGRWRRGGIADVAALPALFVDLDDPSDEALRKLRDFHPMPSCIVDSGGGYHAYWWLQEPASDLRSAASRLRGLSQKLGGDPLSIAHSLRLPGTINTKPERASARCHLIDLRDESYPLSLFEPVAEPARNNISVSPYPLLPIRSPVNSSLNTELISRGRRLLRPSGLPAARRLAEWSVYLSRTSSARGSPLLVRLQYVHGLRILLRLWLDAAQRIVPGSGLFSR